MAARTERPPVPKVPEEDQASEIDLAWDEVPGDEVAAYVDDGPAATLTVPAPPPDSRAEGSVIDVLATSRSANTAAAMGRAPPAEVTTKLKPFQLAEALARATERDEQDS